MRVERQLELRRPLDLLEAEVVRRAVARPGELSRPLLDALRYVIGFARLTLVRNRDGQDLDVSGFLSTHSWLVRSALAPQLRPGGGDLWGAVRELPALVEATRQRRRDLLRSFPLDRESLEREVTRRVFAVVAGGGGGSGYGYAGAFKLLHRAGLRPDFLAGTSMGAIIGLFRARRRHFDEAAMFEAGKRISWSRLFRLRKRSASRYGLPATLQLDLHGALGSLFLDEQERPLTLAGLEIPMWIVTTGITLDALKHDLSYYEHFLDDAVLGGELRRSGIVRRVSGVVSVIRELLSDPAALREIVFGRDEGTIEADVLDAAGFSAAVPGLIHYDIFRDDPRMEDLLDRLYARLGIARMVEGGIVDNVPARVAYEAVMSGRLGTRNLFVLALDCFAPQRRTLYFYPLQQLVRANVQRNLPYTHLYLPLRRVLNALNLAPPIPTLERAMRWTMSELKPHLPFLQEMLRPVEVLPERGGPPV